MFDPGSFDRRLKPAAEFLSNYVTEFNTLPTLDMINAAAELHGPNVLKHTGELNESHYDWLLAEFETFSKHKALEAAILRVLTYLKKVSMDSART